MVSIPPTFSMTLVIILTSMLEENVESVAEEALTEEAEDPEEGEVTGAHWGEDSEEAEAEEEEVSNKIKLSLKVFRSDDTHLWKWLP